MRQRDRIMTMVYGYYFGELIQFSITPKEKWDEFKRDHQIPSSYYLYRGMTRLYQLFKRDPSQIYRTLTLTFNTVSRFKTTEYQQLFQYNQDLHDFTDSLTMS